MFNSGESGHFWNTHDLAEFEDELEEVREPVFVQETAVTIHPQPEEAEALTYSQILQPWESVK